MKFDLTKSKSMWGFGLAILFYFGRKLLVANGVVLPAGEWDWIIQFVNGALVCYGVYGFRDAIRKVQVDQYYNDPLQKNIPKNDIPDNLAKLEQDYQDTQYKNNEKVTFSDNSTAGNYNKDKSIIAECSVTGEPTFCLRAKDILALETISQYYDLTKHHACDPEFIRDVDAVYERFKLWRELHPDTMKIPD